MEQMNEKSPNQGVTRREAIGAGVALAAGVVASNTNTFGEDTQAVVRQQDEATRKAELKKLREISTGLAQKKGFGRQATCKTCLASSGCLADNAAVSKWETDHTNQTGDKSFDEDNCVGLEQRQAAADLAAFEKGLGRKSTCPDDLETSGCQMSEREIIKWEAVHTEKAHNGKRPEFQHDNCLAKAEGNNQKDDQIQKPDGK